MVDYGANNQRNLTKINTVEKLSRIVAINNFLTHKYFTEMNTRYTSTTQSRSSGRWPELNIKKVTRIGFHSLSSTFHITNLK